MMWLRVCLVSLITLLTLSALSGCTRDAPATTTTASISLEAEPEASGDGAPEALASTSEREVNSCEQSCKGDPG